MTGMANSNDKEKGARKGPDSKELTLEEAYFFVPVRTPRGKYKNAEYIVLKDMLSKGKSITEIMDKLGRKEKSIKMVIKSKGWDELINPENLCSPLPIKENQLDEPGVHALYNVETKFTETEEKNLICYKGELGEFDYDLEEFELIKGDPDYLHYKGKGLTVNLPDGCINTNHMFSDCCLPEGFMLGDKFDTSRVMDMSGMFAGCQLSSGFTLGNKFDTSSVTDMKSMFDCCQLPEDFTLGNKFDTSSVMDMRRMFVGCQLPRGFTLGDKFDTSSVKDMSHMFHNCHLSYAFTLGDRFDTSNVINMECMFFGCYFLDDFTLGDKFNTSNVMNMRSMFSKCSLPKGFTLGDKFNTFNVTDMTRMFYWCNLPDGFTLGSKFNTSNVKNMEKTFDAYYDLPESLKEDLAKRRIVVK